MNKNQCDHANLEKVEEDTEQGHSSFKCLDCGRMIAKDKHICVQCGGLPVDDIVGHMLRVHGFDTNRWQAVTGLGDKDRDWRKDKEDLV
jgi:hypothetical protein